LLSKKGYALLELIACLTIFSVLLIAMLPMCKGILRISETSKIETVCRLLAVDIADIQNKSLCSNIDSPAYIIMLDRYGDGYTIFKNQAILKKVKFSEIGLDPVVATCANTNKIAFSTTGSPKTAVSVNVYNKNNATKRKFVQVQPVTGRIVIEDEAA